MQCNRKSTNPLQDFLVLFPYFSHFHPFLNHDLTESNHYPHTGLFTRPDESKTPWKELVWQSDVA